MARAGNGHFTLYNLVSWKLVLTEADGVTDTHSARSDPLHSVEQRRVVFDRSSSMARTPFYQLSLKPCSDDCRTRLQTCCPMGSSDDQSATNHVRQRRLLMQYRRVIQYPAGKFAAGFSCSGIADPTGIDPRRFHPRLCLAISRLQHFTTIPRRAMSPQPIC